jgi:tetratricopeptide (TPR) repeat protein
VIAATHTLLGASYRELGYTDRAESEFRAALEIDPKYEEALFNLPCCEQKMILAKLARYIAKGY